MICLKDHRVFAFVCLAITCLVLAAAQTSYCQVKYVYSLDYPLAQKSSYLDWVKSIAETLQAPDEIKGIVSYDNVFGVSPHRFIEFEFENMAKAGAYFERPEVNQILEHVVNHGVNGGLIVLERRADYESVAGADRGAIKYLITLDYPLAMKDSYLEWVQSVADSLHAPPEVVRITSNDNYFGTSPHRYIEFEFEDMEAAARYFERPSISRVFEEVVDHGVNGRLAILRLRSDYTAAP